MPWATSTVDRSSPRSRWTTTASSRRTATATAGDPRRTGRPFPTTTFLTPPLATVGMTESEARAAGHEVLVADKDVAAMAMMPRPKIVGEPGGLWRIVVDASTRQVLGAAILCVDAQEVVNTIALAMRSGTTADELRDAIYVHPSTTEGLNDVLGTI